MHSFRLLLPASSCDRELRCRGFTVPELAVIVAVLIVGLAITAPYLLDVREKSRQATCRERLRTLAAATVRQVDERQAFLAGQTARRSKSQAIGRYADPEEPRDSGAGPASGASWMLPLLPLLDQKSLFDRWDQKRSVAANADVAQTNLPVISCPSRRVDGRLSTACDRIAESWSGGGNDYAACSGSGITFYDEARQTWDLDAAQIEATSRNGVSPYSTATSQRGLFGVNSSVSKSDVQMADGIAYVVLLAERRVFANASPNEQRSSDGWAWGGPATLFSTRYAPHTGAHYDEADSEHPGLVHVAMADARTTPVNWNIDLRTWNNLGNYAQGSPLEHPDFRR